MIMMKSMVFCKQHSGVHSLCLGCDEPDYLGRIDGIPYSVQPHLSPGTVKLDPTAPPNRPRVLCQSASDLQALITAANT